MLNIKLEKRAFGGPLWRPVESSFPDRKGVVNDAVIGLLLRTWLSVVHFVSNVRGDVQWTP